MFHHSPHSTATDDSRVTSTDPLTGAETLPLSLAVTSTEDPRSRDSKLSAAVNQLIPAALERRQGILVMEHDAGKYTVQVAPEVPCGTIHEKRCS